MFKDRSIKYPTDESAVIRHRVIWKTCVKYCYYLITIMHTAVSVNTFFPRISFVSLLERIMEVTTLNIIRSFTLRFRIQRRIIFHAVEDDR